MNNTARDLQGEETANAANRKNDPLSSWGKTAISDEPRRNFVDARAWNEMAKKHLPRYQLPKWSIRPTPELMDLWLERSNIPIPDYQRNFDSFADFVELNPDWPLRAWIGLMLEWKDDHGSQP